MYDRDLPSLSELDPYNPTTRSELNLRIPDGGEAFVHVVPAAEFGKHLLKAVVAAQGEVGRRSPILDTIAGLVGDKRPQKIYAFRLARGMGLQGRSLRRQLGEVRLAERIYRRYRPQQILTIYMNRVDLGEGARGMEDASVR